MKLLLINWQDWLNPLSGGAEVHLHEIFKRIAANHEITLFCSKHEGALDEEVVDNIKIIRRGQRNTFNFLVPKFYNKLFKNQDFDIVIDDINKIPFYTPLFVKKPLLAISHHFFGNSIFRESGYIAGSYVYFSEILVNLIYKNTPFAVVSQSTLNEFIERGFDKKNFSIVPNAITQEEFPMQISVKYAEPSVAYFGRLKKYKSVDHLFYAFSKVLEKISNAKLHIIGRGDFKDHLVRIATQMNIIDNIKFWGFVSEKQKVEILSKVHCVANTSMKEGWGITNIEANACGTPVISANSPGLRDSVKNGVSGLLYEYADIDELSEVIYMLLTEKELHDKLSKGSIEWAKSFSWDYSAELMLDKCYEVINEFKKKEFLKSK
jgi:glycosyltransferase involved in cell wall biosynthesis